MVEKLIAELAEQPASTSFAEWLRREMPPDTYIADPDWWAPRIYRAVCKAQAEQPAEPQGEPVAHGFAPNADGKITDALVVGRNDDPEYNIPLYARPDPRVSVLEGLLREAQGTLQKIKLRIHFIGWPAEPKREDGCVDWREEIRALEDSLKRIAAALGGGMMEDHSLFQEVTCNLCGLDKRIAALERDLAAAQQGESIEQGMRKECEEYIAVLKADLAAAQAKIAGNAELIAKFVKAAADAEAEAAALRVDAAEDESILREVGKFMTHLLLNRDAFSGNIALSAGPAHDRVRARIAAIDQARGGGNEN